MPSLQRMTLRCRQQTDKTGFYGYYSFTADELTDPVTDPANGDSSIQPGSILLGDDGTILAGLTDPEPIRMLWNVWTSHTKDQGLRDR